MPGKRKLTKPHRALHGLPSALRADVVRKGNGGCCLGKARSALLSGTYGPCGMPERGVLYGGTRRPSCNANFCVSIISVLSLQGSCLL